jgi:erythromycin esterase-like protein
VVPARPCRPGREAARTGHRGESRSARRWTSTSCSIYRPETERFSHCFHARLAAQFDAVIHIDETRALEPLDVTSEWEAGELPETYPFAV